MTHIISNNIKQTNNNIKNEKKIIRIQIKEKFLILYQKKKKKKI